MRGRGQAPILAARPLLQGVTIVSEAARIGCQSPRSLHYLQFPKYADWFLRRLILRGTGSSGNWFFTGLALPETGSLGNWFSRKLVLSETGSPQVWFSWGLASNFALDRLPASRRARSEIRACPLLRVLPLPLHENFYFSAVCRKRHRRGSIRGRDG